MRRPISDAIVFFGATGDLAHKKIFPALQGLIRDEGLDIPIIGVAKAGWSLDQLKARAKDSLLSHGGLNSKAFAKLTICSAMSMTIITIRKPMCGCARNLRIRGDRCTVSPFPRACLRQWQRDSQNRAPEWKRASLSRNPLATIERRRVNSIAFSTIFFRKKTSSGLITTSVRSR